MLDKNVQKILDELNGARGKDWVIADGFHAISTSTEPIFSVNGSYSYKADASTGMVVKSFYNKKTGEIKMYLVKTLAGF